MDTGASTSTSSKRNHHALTIEKKIELLKKLDQGFSVRKLRELFGVGSTTVYDIKRQRDKLLKFYSKSLSSKQMINRKNMKEGKSQEHDRVMIEWFRLRRADGVDLSGSMIMNQAKLFHEQLQLDHSCEYSEGWLHRFKQRHGISTHKVCGEKRAADQEGANQFVNIFAQIVADESLSPEQVYNADETALYWRCTPRRTLATEDEIDLTGFKQSKDRVTILACSNAAGSHRCKPMVIGKSKCPRALKGVKVYPVIYRANKNGWITIDLMLEWFQNFFIPQARTHCASIGLPQDCKILLILDNCSAHPKPELMCKDNVRTVYLPPNCTSLIQPLDQGILRSLKAKYRSIFMKHLLNAVNAGSSVQEFIKNFNMKDVLWCTAQGWENVEASTLKHGWHKLWPATRSDSNCEEISDDCDYLSKQKEIVNELLDYAKNVKECAAEDIGNLDEQNLQEWMNVDNELPVVPLLTDAEIINKVLNNEENSDSSSSDDDEKQKDKNITLDQVLEGLNTAINGLERRNIITEQELMSLHLIVEKVYREKLNRVKQLRVDDMFAAIAKKNSQ